MTREHLENDGAEMSSTATLTAAAVGGPSSNSGGGGSGSREYYRPAHLRDVPCSWRFHSVVSPCLCEQQMPALPPIDVLNLRRQPGANTPWLGSPSFTNLTFESCLSPPPPPPPPPPKARAKKSMISIRVGSLLPLQRQQQMQTMQTTAQTTTQQEQQQQQRLQQHQRQQQQRPQQQQQQRPQQQQQQQPQQQQRHQQQRGAPPRPPLTKAGTITAAVAVTERKPKPYVHPHPLFSNPPFPPTPSSPEPPAPEPVQAKRATRVLAAHTHSHTDTHIRAHPHAHAHAHAPWETESIISAPSTYRPRHGRGASTHIMSPMSPISVSDAEWPDFCSRERARSRFYHSHGSEANGDGQQHQAPPPQSQQQDVPTHMNWSGLCISTADAAAADAADLEPSRPRTTDGRPTEEMRRQATVANSILFFPPLAEWQNLDRDSVERQSSTRLAATVPPEYETPAPASSTGQERVSEHEPKTLISAPLRRQPSTNRDVSHVDSATAAPVSLPWRHPLRSRAADEPERRAGDVPAAPMSMPLPMSEGGWDGAAKPLPQVPMGVGVAESTATRYLGGKPSRSGLGLGMEQEDPNRRRTIEPSGVGIEPAQWLDLQLAVMGVAGPWNSCYEETSP